jgi:hypothetical protein
MPRKENLDPLTRVFRRGRQGIGQNQRRQPAGPPFLRPVRTAMPFWSAAARDLRDMQWLPQWKGQRRDGPGVEGNQPNVQPAARQ